MKGKAALEAQELEIPLNLGMATKPAVELQEPTHMRLVQNLHWRGLGELEHRPSDDVSHTIDGAFGGAYDEDGTTCGLVVRDNVPAVVTRRNGVMTYNATLDEAQWARGGVDLSAAPSHLRYCPVSYEVSRRFVERAQFTDSSSGISHIASAQHEGVQVIVWHEVIGSGPSGKLWFKAIRAETGEVVATPEYIALSSPTISFCQACEYTESGSEGVLIAYVDYVGATNTVKTVLYNAALNIFSAGANLTTDYAGAFRIVKNGDRIFFGYHKNSTGRLIVEDRTVSTISSTHTSTTHGADGGIAIVSGPTNTLIVSCTDGALGEAYAEVFGSPGSAINPISAGGATNDVFYDVAVALEEQSLYGSTHDAVMWVQAYGAIGGSVDALRVRAIEINFDATTPVEGLNTMLPHCQMVTGGFTLHGQAHITLSVLTVLNGVSATVPTSCFVARYRSDGAVARHDAVARICHDRYFQRGATGLVDAFRATGAVHVEDDNAWIALPADAPADTLYLPRAQTVFLERVSAASPMPMPFAQPEPGVTLVAGGLPWTYDGDIASEATPLIQPQLFVTDSGGGPISGTFGLIAMYRFTDAAGRQHRIASTPVSTSALVTRIVTVRVSTCPMRAYDGVGVADMDVELYITADGGSTYYLATDSSGDKLLPATNRDYFHSFELDQGGSTSDPPFPFDTGAGGEISPEPPPALLHVSKIADRMWGVDAEDRSRVWFSKPLVAGVGVEWSTFCTLYVGDETTAVVDVGGYPTALARGGIYQIAGPGPDANGNGTFSPAQRLPFEVDCLDPVSVCRTPLGIVFRGRRGLYALSDGPRAEPGLLIDPEMLTAANLDPSSTNSYRLRVAYQEQTNEIHCITPAGDRLIYNVIEQKWAKYTTTNTTCRDVVNARGKIWRLEHGTVSGADLLRSEKLYSEAGADYNANDHDWEVRTPWLKLNGLAGQQRLWRLIVVLGLPTDVADISLITVGFYANNSETLSRAQSWTGAEIAAIYDPSTGEQVVRLPFAPNVQLVHSFKVHVTCVIGQANPTSGPRPLAMNAEVGVRPSKGKRNPVAVKG